MLVLCEAVIGEFLTINLCTHQQPFIVLQIHKGNSQYKAFNRKPNIRKHVRDNQTSLPSHQFHGSTQHHTTPAFTGKESHCGDDTLSTQLFTWNNVSQHVSTCTHTLL